MSSNGNTPGPERGSLSDQEREAIRQRAAALGKRLDQVHARKAPPPGDSRARGAALGQAFKIVAELLIGVVVGGGIGWALDKQLGSSPWLLMLFLLFGFAAGILNVVRSARQMQAAAEPLQRSAPSVPDDDDEDEPGPTGQPGSGAGKPGAGRV